MGLEIGSYINDLVPTNPTGSDPKSAGDDHLRLIKEAAKNCFPGFTGAILVGGDDVGLVNAYVLSPSNALVAYVENTMVLWRPTNTNTSTTPTINISGLGARDIRDVTGNVLLPGDLPAGQYVAMVDDGTQYRLVGVTKNYVDNLSFSGAFPTPPAGEGPFFLVASNGVFGYTSTTTPDFLLQAQGVL